MKRFWPIFLGTLAAVLYAVWALAQDDGEGASPVDKLADGIRELLNGIAKGDRVTHAPYSKVTGMVPGSPQSLADVAGVDVETYSLARVIASEEGLSSAATQAAVGHSVRNHANTAGKSITAVLTYAKLASHRGSYGTQRNIEVGTDGYNGSDRYASTANDPYAGHLEVAIGIMDGSIPDFTNGADQFDRPAGERDPEAVEANRIAGGSEEVDLTGVVDDGIRFWRKV